MRALSTAVVAVSALFAGCVTPPVELHSRIPDLGIAAAAKKPLKVAVVVADPMAYSLFYQGQGTYTRDMTAEMRAQGFPLEAELSRIAADTFSQAFASVVVLRDLPAPGQYDAVVRLDIVQILFKEHVVVTGETCDMTAAWTMSVLDRKNKEVLARKGVSSSHNFAWSAFNPGRGWVMGINEHLPQILTELAQGWGADVHALPLGKD
ncbi:MAG: hypothetical protein HY079_10835 [Elusimicrobia bacterium]|nr:hypothetical protein [Elusimicrobiota bacterium]